MTRTRSDAVAGRPRRRFVLLGLVSVAVLAVLAAGWLGWRGLEAKRALEKAEGAAADVKTALAAGDPAAARSAAGRLRDEAAEAHALTSDPLWRVAAAVPYAGDNLRAVAEVAAVVDGLASGPMTDLLGSADAFDPASLRPSGDRVDLALLRDVAPALRSASEEMASAERRVSALRHLHLAGPVAQAVDDLDARLADAREVSSDAASAAGLLPSMLGGDGPRQYLLAFQNNAEARGTGGLLGAYGVLEARKGRVELVRLGSNTELQSASRLPVDFGKGFRRRYGNDPALWANANMSPHFPYAARTWMTLWERQTGQRLDGVVATDPVVLGYILDVTGPVRLADGTKVTGANAAEFTMSEVYARYPGFEDNEVRDAYLQQVAREAFTSLLSGAGEPRALLDALDRAASEHRLLAYSRHDAEQEALAGTVLGGTLPDARRPYVAAVVNDTGGSKLDYYLQRSVTYDRRECVDGRQRSRVEVTLRNDSPPARKLPTYVKVRVDDAAWGDASRLGHNRARVSVFLPVGAHLEAASQDGGKMRVSLAEERNRPTVDFPVELGPGESTTVVLWVDEPARPGQGRIWTQPLVRPADTTVTTDEDAATCAAG